MTDGTNADARLERLLHILPAAMRDDGATLAALAEALDTSEERILEDLEEVTSRVYYQPGGWPDDVQIFVEADRIRVQRAAGFERPARLSRDETLCLALALRGTAASARLAGNGKAVDLLERAEAHLGQPAEEGSEGVPIEAPERDPDLDGIRETVLAAARERRPCALWYVKAGASDGSVRVVHPYAVVHAEGAWYTVAWCTTESAIRVFRMDRVLAADLADGSFDVPDDFQVDDYLDGARVFHAPQSRSVRIRYSGRIAPWIRERVRWEPERVDDRGDEGVVVSHEVADPSWAVSHVLLYGGEAEVMEPEEMRGLVRETAEEVVE